MTRIIIEANKKQNSPATATVVNFGVSFLHLKVTEKTENPTEEVMPKINPTRELSPVFPNAIIIIPTVAIIIEIQTLTVICSFKKMKAKSAVKNGIAAKQSNVIAAVVLVIEYIKEIIAIPRPEPPSIPDFPIFK